MIPARARRRQIATEDDKPKLRAAAYEEGTFTVEFKSGTKVEV